MTQRLRLHSNDHAGKDPVKERTELRSILSRHRRRYAYHATLVRCDMNLPILHSTRLTGPTKTKLNGGHGADRELSAFPKRKTLKTACHLDKLTVRIAMNVFARSKRIANHHDIWCCLLALFLGRRKRDDCAILPVSGHIERELAIFVARHLFFSPRADGKARRHNFMNLFSDVI